jgi:prepilin-type N-terminal cleavage/methylation domain-containing protein
MKTYRGFSIVETLIAVAIVGIIATAIMSFFPTISRTNQSTRTDQEFTIAAKRFMEGVRGAWTNTTEGRENFDNTTLSDGTSLDGYQIAGLPNDFSCVSAVSDSDAGAYTPIQRKRVSLSCNAPGSSPVSFTIEFGRPE